MTDRLTQGLSPWALLAILLVGLYLACTPEPVQVRLVPNLAPETIATGAPLDSSNAFHRYHLYWFGVDPDGQVVEYALAVADSNIAPEFSDYRRTTATDTIIEFVANNEVVLAHSFWVFAIDNEGQRDETPARVYFNAVDSNRPVPMIVEHTKTVDGVTSTLALDDTMSTAGSSVHFTWTAFDADLGGEIRAYRIKLSTEIDFTEIPADSTGATYSGLPSGEYEFLVEAVDNAGAESLEPARWSWVVNYEPDTRIIGMEVNGVPVPNFQGGLVDGQPCMWPGGVPTIHDSSRVTFFFEGNDRDGTVTGFSFRDFRYDIASNCRLLRRPFSVRFDSTHVTLPFTRPFFTSNDYEIFIRSHDNEGKPDGTPPSIKFHVNFSPVLRKSALFPGPGAVVDSSDTAVNDTLTVRFLADDVETPPTVLAYRTVLDGVYGLVVVGVPDTSLLRQRWRFPAVGQHALRYFATDPGSRADTLDVTFTVVP